MINDKLIIKNKEIQNRIVIPPMASRSATIDGFVTDNTINYYKNINCDNNCGVVIVEHCYVSIEGKAHPLQLGCDNLDKVEGLKKISDTIKSQNALSIIQISHAGLTSSSSVTSHPSVGVSNVTFGTKNLPDKILSSSDIEKVIEKFVNGACVASLAGFDGVEIHSAHGYLLNQFYSSNTNKRDDIYGGSIENRIRIHLEIIKRIKEKCPNLIIFLRLGAYDYFENTLSNKSDYITASILFEKANIDVLDISGGLSGYILKDRINLEGYFYDVTKEIKKHVTIPVILTGGIKTKEAILNHLENKNCDLIGIGRMILNNNHFIKENIL